MRHGKQRHDRVLGGVRIAQHAAGEEYRVARPDGHVLPAGTHGPGALQQEQLGLIGDLMHHGARVLLEGQHPQHPHGEDILLGRVTGRLVRRPVYGCATLGNADPRHLRPGRITHRDLPLRQGNRFHRGARDMNELGGHGRLGKGRHRQRRNGEGQHAGHHDLNSPLLGMAMISTVQGSKPSTRVQ